MKIRIRNKALIVIAIISTLMILVSDRAIWRFSFGCAVGFYILNFKEGRGSDE